MDVPQPLVAPEEDTGPFVKALLEDAPGKSLIGTRAWMSLRELMEAVAGVTGIKTEAIKLPDGESAFAELGELRLEMEECVAYFNEFGYTGGDPNIVDPKDVSFPCLMSLAAGRADTNAAQQLANPPQLASVEEYLRKQDWAKILGE